MTPGYGDESIVGGSPCGDPACVLPGLECGAGRRRSTDRRGHGEVATALRSAGPSAQLAGNGGDTVTQSGEFRGLEAVDGHRYATWDAAYVLGSLSSAERREYEAHLETCDRCRSAVAEIRGIPALHAIAQLQDG